MQEVTKVLVASSERNFLIELQMQFTNSSRVEANAMRCIKEYKHVSVNISLEDFLILALINLTVNCSQ
jgi:hypothetical protein